MSQEVFTPRKRVDFDYENYQGFLAPDRNHHEELTTANYQFPTDAMFIEKNANKDFRPIYTLSDKAYEVDGKVIPSAYLIYMHSVDETEAALKLVGSLQNWRKLISKPWFLNGIASINNFEGLAQWREDMKLRDEMEIKRLLKEEALAGNVTAMKALQSSDGIPKAKARSRKEVKGDMSVVDLEDNPLFSGFRKASEG